MVSLESEMPDKALSRQECRLLLAGKAGILPKKKTGQGESTVGFIAGMSS